jgi:hypothetical protein
MLTDRQHTITISASDVLVALDALRVSAEELELADLDDLATGAAVRLVEGSDALELALLDECSAWLDRQRAA